MDYMFLQHRLASANLCNTASSGVSSNTASSGVSSNTASSGVSSNTASSCVSSNTVSSGVEQHSQQFTRCATSRCCQEILKCLPTIIYISNNE